MSKFDHKTDNHFKDFTNALSDLMGPKIKYKGEEWTEFQKGQIEGLVQLESEFRDLLIAHPDGSKVYQKFIRYVTDIKRNVLSARPYFRERNTTTTELTSALKNKNVPDVQKLNINFNFILFAINKHSWEHKDETCNWDKKSDIYLTYKKIEKLRNSIVVSNMPLAINEAKRFFRKNPRTTLGYMDFIQIAAVGLITGIDKFCLPFSKVFRSVAIGRMVGDFINFNCVHQNTILITCSNEHKQIKDFVLGDKVWGIDDSGKLIETEVLALHDHGTIDGYEATFEDGYKITSSLEHKFLTQKGMTTLKEIFESGLGVYCEPPSQSWGLDDSLWTNVSNEKTLVDPQENLRELSVLRDGSQERMVGQGKDFGEESGRLDFSLPAAVSDPSIQRRSSDKLSGMQIEGFPGPVGQHYQVEKRESGKSRGENGYLSSNLTTKESNRPILGLQSGGEAQSYVKETKSREPGGICGQDETYLVGSKTIQDGSMAPFIGNVDLGGNPNKLWRRTKTSGFRFSGSQDLDRSGRGVSFQGSFNQKIQTTEYTTTGQNTFGRSNPQGGRDVNPVGNDVLLQSRGNEEGMAGLAFKDAPLTATGNLVLRRIIRLRPVGQCHMYDLEVAHPKHNFLLPNGIVTSNSSPILHFFPGDRQKLYRANKALKKTDPNDLQSIVDQVNEQKGVTPVHTDQDEIRALLIAQSCVSADQPVQYGDEQVFLSDILTTSITDRPDLVFERNDLSDKLHCAIDGLTVLEQKLLKMKGVGI